MDYTPHRYKNQNGMQPSLKYKSKRALWFNSNFTSDFVLIDNKIYEISFDTNPFEIYKFNRLKVLSYIRDSNQSKPIQVKLKFPLAQSREVVNTDLETYPIIYNNHSGARAMHYNDKYSVRLIPQQIPRFIFRLDDNISNYFTTNSILGTITNGEIVNLSKPNEQYVIFKTSGSLVLNNDYSVDLLVVGGGGGGGGGHAGGGGAGAVIYLTSQSLKAGTYTITIGAGGTPVPRNTTPTAGGDTTIVLGGSTIYRAKGGGGGGGALASGLSGGSAGAPGTIAANNGTVVTTNIPVGAYGNLAGNSLAPPGTGGYDGFIYLGGGGGGAGSAGQNAYITSGVAYGGNGGNGLLVPITGVNTYYGGGGGGGTISVAGLPRFFSGSGGLGGGGAGGEGGTGIAGIANTGGGGGGGGAGNPAGDGSGGIGGSGVVIFRLNTNKRNEGITANETLVQTTNASIPVTVNSKYMINYQTPVDLPKGTYEATFSNGSITLTSNPNYEYATTSKAPLLWYKFDGSQFLYNSGTEPLHLTNNGNVVYDTSIYKKGIGSAFFQDISNQYLSGSGISISNRSFSISFWAYPMNSSRGCFIVFGSTAINQGFYIAYGVDGYYTNQWLASIIGVANIFSGTVNDLNTWVHIAYTVNSSTKNRILYRNGVKVAEETFANNMTTTGTNYTFGYLDASFPRTNGKIDDFRFYDYVLSPIEVYDLYNGPNVDRSYPLLKDANNNTINPLVWYQFDTGNLLVDSSGNSYTLTNNGTVTINQNDFVKGNGSASFTSSSQWLNNSSFLNLSSRSWSISFWVKKTNDLTTDYLIKIGSGGASYQTFAMYFDATNKLIVSNYNSTVETPAFSVANRWVHICFTYLTGTKRGTIYRDGVQIVQGTYNGEVLVDTNLYIGSLATVTVDNLKGLLDDVRIYESVLTATQVSELYNGRIGIYNPPSFMLGVEMEDEKLSRINTISTNNRTNDT